MTDPITTFVATDFAAGAIAALVFGLLIRVRFIAMTVATLLALSAFGILLDPSGPGAVLDDITQLIGHFAASGALTGAMLATTASAFLKTLYKSLTRTSSRHHGKRSSRS